jgi:hypothetical protein
MVAWYACAMGDVYGRFLSEHGYRTKWARFEPPTSVRHYAAAWCPTKRRTCWRTGGLW